MPDLLERLLELEKEKELQVSGPEVKNKVKKLPVEDHDSVKKIEKKQVKKSKITQDKKMNKEQIIEYIITLLTNNKTFFTLDFLRSQKLIYDLIYFNR